MAIAKNIRRTIALPVVSAELSNTDVRAARKRSECAHLATRFTFLQSQRSKASVTAIDWFVFFRFSDELSSCRTQNIAETSLSDGAQWLTKVASMQSSCTFTLYFF
mmetsp:Transcript_29180/g.47324  ORF Transcript_29180/g.47324 Transcript_29180/m.47324 type:complete len:106 (+) Transcript_29180:378-695(+)